jgi:hypothetical protein
VRQDHPVLRIPQLHRAEQAPGRRAVRRAHLVDEQRLDRVHRKHLVGQPALEQRGGTPVPVTTTEFGLVLLWKDQPHDIGRVARGQGAPIRRRDHVVRR